MPAITYEKVAGVWQPTIDPEANVAGTYHQVQEIYGNVAGVWHTVYKRNFVFNHTFSSDVLDYNLNGQMVAGGWNGVDPVIVSLLVNAGIYVGSSTSGAALIIPSFPALSTVALVNGGFIVGKGGVGGHGGNGTHLVPGTGFDGLPGGLALSVAFATSIDNTGGVIGGGGGGAGGNSTSNDGDNGGNGGGGGRGLNNAAGGVKGTGPLGNGVDGGAGSKTAPGANGTGENGGQFGQPGDHGNDNDTFAGNGGAAGACLTGNSNISWIAFGSRLGAIT